MAEVRSAGRRFGVVRSTSISAPPRSGSRVPGRASDSLLVFSVIFFAILIPHLPLLGLPYFWDEAGYYIPAARDLLLSGWLIPHTTLSNAHPPLVMAWLALWWKLVGLTPVVTRTAMLVVAAAALAGVYRVALITATREVAIAATVCTALWPPFFAQSTLAHLDMAAAALTVWALVFYLERWTIGYVITFSLAALAKETAIIAPLALFVWELASHELELRTHRRLCAVPRSSWRESLALLIPAAPLALWFGFHWARTGHVFGSPGFFQYNVAQTFSPARFLFAFIQRLWQLTGSLNLYLLSLATLAAMFYSPLAEGAGTRRAVVVNLGEHLRERIAIPTQLVFAAVIAAYVLFLSAVGGALLARYMLPAVPLWILLCVSTLRRRIRMWKPIVAVIALAFALALMFPPPYRIAPEDTLAYRDFIELQQSAARQLQQMRPAEAVLTAWPATDELQRPFLGYVAQPMATISLENFSRPELDRAATQTMWKMAVLFSTKYEPKGGSLLDRIGWWRRAHERWFGYHEDMRPEAAAQLLHARIVWANTRPGQWVAILVRE